MIVDVHYHYMRLPSDDAAARMVVGRWVREAERAGIKKTLDKAMPLFRDYMDDVECDKLIKRMNESDIDVTVICVTDSINYGFNDDRAMRVNGYCAKASAKHPGHIIALSGIDPRRPNAPALARKCIEELHMGGLKWHPDEGYYPNSPESYAVLEAVKDLNVPLLVHTGPLSNSKAKFCHPLLLDDLAVDFPNMSIIAAHMGDMLWRDWAAMARHKKNIYGDLAMWQYFFHGHPETFRRYLREILDVVGPDQILFGTDGPIYEPNLPNRRYVEMIQNLTTESDGIKFSTREVEAILGGNAARIFKL